MIPPALDTAHVPQLLDDLDLSTAELLERVADPAAWTHGPPHRWTVGQHVEHVARSLAIAADAFERAADAHTRGTLPKRPWRDPLQSVFVRVVTGARFPRGGRSPAVSRPAKLPDRERSIHDVAEGARRYRILADRLTPGQHEQIWIWNPYVPRFKWHYLLPEILRVQANHNRHHALLIDEALAVGARA